jgi:hypothetical protein
MSLRGVVPPEVIGEQSMTGYPHERLQVTEPVRVEAAYTFCPRDHSSVQRNPSANGIVGA